MSCTTRDGQTRFSLQAAGAAGWVVSENRHDANGNIIEVRAYDRFLPDARVAALDSAASPGITVAEIEQELSALGYADNDPASLAGVQRTFVAYDANNRQRFTVDPSGSVVENVYDAAGNVIATVRFAVRPTARRTQRGGDRRRGRSRRPGQSSHALRLRCGQPSALHRRCAGVGQ